MARHRWLSGGSGGSSRVSAWILNPAAAAAAKSNAMTIQTIGRSSSYPDGLAATDPNGTIGGG
jgi:hypothetical protein